MTRPVTAPGDTLTAAFARLRGPATTARRELAAALTKADVEREREWARSNDPVDGRDPDDGPWISERDIDDQIAGRHFPLNERMSE